MSCVEISALEAETACSSDTRTVLASLAQELRSPIAAIQGALTMLESAGRLPGATDVAHRVIHKQLSEMSLLVENVLELESAAWGRMTLHRERINLVSEIDAAISTCSWGVAGCHHPVSLELPLQAIHAYVDRMRLRQVIATLIHNACKRGPASGHIKVIVKKAGEHAILTIASTGEGTASDPLDVFEPPAVSTSEGADAARVEIGLTLVSEIVALHGGTIDLRSAGSGSRRTFIVRWPLSCSPYLDAYR